MRPRPKTSALRLFCLLAALVALAAALLPAQAAAEPPFRLGSQLEDRADVLGGRAGEVQAALARLADDEQVQLWVVYVDTFSGLSPQEWADETATTSDLGLNDALLAVAVEDRAYAYSVDQDFPLTQTQLSEVMVVAVEPALRRNDWAGAAIGAAEGFGQALSGDDVTAPGASGGGVSTGLIVAVAVVILLVAAAVWMLARRARGRSSMRAGPAPEQAEAVPLADLRKQANAALVETDDAIKTSAEELGFAVAEFGETQAEPFRNAISTAQRDLDEAFRLRKQLDATGDEAGQRALLMKIVQLAGAANDALDAEADRFDRLRDLGRRAPEVLDRLEARLAELEARLPAVQQLLSQLSAEYAASALAPLAGAPAEAAERVRFAREHVAAGREDLAAARSGEAAIEITAAEGAVEQAQQLLDGVERLRDELAGARTRIDDAVAETRRDIAEAQGSNVPALAGLVATAEAAVSAAEAAAGPDGGRDPLGALRRIKDADDALEQALQQVRDAQARRTKAVASLERQLVAARSDVASASDFISTHRGGIGSEPRALLAEAHRRLAQAEALATTDPERAAQEAALAQQAAAQAFSRANEEASQVMGVPGMGRMPGMGGDLAGMILGGLLVGGMLGGGRGGYGGGFGGLPGGGGRRGGGGFAPPGFGGGGTRMRRGGGGRF